MIPGEYYYDPNSKGDMALEAARIGEKDLMMLLNIIYTGFRSRFRGDHYEVFRSGLHQVAEEVLIQMSGIATSFRTWEKSIILTTVGEILGDICNNEDTLGRVDVKFFHIDDEDDSGEGIGFKIFEKSIETLTYYNILIVCSSQYLRQNNHKLNNPKLN